MGEVIIKKWECDRCGDVYDKRQVPQYPIISIVITESHEWYRNAYEWKEMCPKCNTKALNELKDMLK